MRSIDRLALGSVICGVGGMAVFCLLLFFPTFEYTGLSVVIMAYLYVFLVVLAPFGAVALGLAALKRPGVRSGERRGRTQAKVGFVLGLLQVPLFGLAVIYAFSLFN
jgi:multisubunit Na+/H+ antiporter MnhG subunit